MVLDSFFNLLFKWVIDIDPTFGIAFIAFILTFLITLIYKYMTDQEFMKKTKQEIKDVQKEMKNHKHDHKKVMELQKHAMEKNMKYMMQSFKPMLITFIPIIIMFGWLRKTYELSDPLLFGWGWIWWYIIFSILFSMIIRRVLKVH